MKGVWERDPSNFDHIMILAACTLCFFGFLRSGEITVPSDNGYDPGAHVRFTDVAIDDRSIPNLMRIRIKASKTDPFRKGVDIFLGRTGDDICPISAMLAYLAIRGEGPGPLFRFASGKPLTRDRLVTEIRSALSAAGHREQLYAGHSFRVGAATTAAKQGISDSAIQTLGRWKSAAYLAYVRIPRERFATISKTLSARSVN